MCSEGVNHKCNQSLPEDLRTPSTNKGPPRLAKIRPGLGLDRRGAGLGLQGKPGPAPWDLGFASLALAYTHHTRSENSQPCDGTDTRKKKFRASIRNIPASPIALKLGVNRGNARWAWRKSTT
ncbi:hypothetical protein Mapa_006005 [Marchantia paleacea]|nr:hypothetical protein Mapa_006005 [Marchantia paleacea]